VTKLQSRLFLSTLIVLFSFAIIGGTTAAADTPNPIEQRQEAMKSIGKAMKGLAAIAKGEVPFDPASVQQHATTIADNLHTASGLFPEGSGPGTIETRAKPEIWTNKADFDSKLKAAHQAAVELAAVSDQAAYRPALGKLGQACRSCHDSYRAPEEEE